MRDRPAQQLDLRPWQHGAIFLFAIVILVARRPDAILHAQFWAEDGHVWFADAYNMGGWTALTQVHTGYFQTFPRLGALLALLVPLALAPLVLNLLAIAVQALLVNLLLSARSSAWGAARSRALFAGMYLALPNCKELSYGITESQWMLALCVFLLLVASKPRSLGGRILDFLIVLLCGLTGPFCITLFPIALFLALKERSRGRWATAGVLAALCLIQAWALLIMDPAGRSSAVLGASPALCARILAGQVFLGALLGGNGLAANSSPWLLIFLLCVAVGGIVFVAFTFFHFPMPFRLFLILSLVLFALALVSPTGWVPEGVSAWANLATGPGIRYWFFPTLAFAWSLLWGFQSRSGALKTVSVVLLCLMCFGIVRDWRHPAFKDMHFADYAKSFEAAPAGTAATIPENPAGWTVRLVKHPPGR
jgi:hypothetical protein